MSAQTHRLDTGGRVDRTRALRFTFDGRPYTGHPGDTLASALLANGVRLVGRSFKYHRPRGILSAGSEEPNALVTIGEGDRLEPNTRATTVDLVDGLVARSQNAWPSLTLDAGVVNSALSPVLSAGFYYKTFMGGPRGAWTRLYEPLIRRAAGLGPAPVAADPDRYDKRHAHPDVLVVGAGPAGLAAARAAAAGGARVLLLDEGATLGGSLLRSDATVDGRPAGEWVDGMTAELAAMPEATVLTRTTAFGRYDGNLVMAVQRLGGDAAAASQRLWQIRPRALVIAAGAHEQPLVFSGNDRPGVMLASAAQHYLRHHGVRVGRRVVVAAIDDAGHEAARALAAAGAAVLVADGRASDGGSDPDVLWETAVAATHGGDGGVTGVDLLSSDGARRTVACDAVLMAGGWQPALHLHSHAGGRTRWDDARGCFVADAAEAGVALVGGAAGNYGLARCLADGHAAGLAAAEAVGRAGSCEAPATAEDAPGRAPGPMFAAPAGKKAFVDFQNDVAAADIDLAYREGFVSVEHLKRYTTTGMATDQGKLSNRNAIARMAGLLGTGPAGVGTTTFRPPYTPVTLSAIAALDRGDRIDPVRTTPLHPWHVANGAVFENVGQWKRPWYYPQARETMDEAVRRECAAVRATVGMLDASTLGKIDLQGPDAAVFLNRVYTNAWLKLEVGRARYGVMCGEDGMVLDDGVTLRTGPERYLMTTTTGNAARVLDHLEDLLQTEWPDLRVTLTSVTDHWAACVVTGPRARDVLARVATDVDLSNEDFPHMSVRDARVAGVAVRLYRISFTGELSYEVHVPAQHGTWVWEALFDAGHPDGLTPYGTETMHVLRAEKGYIIMGQETDGTVTPDDLGLGWAIAKSKPDFVGKRSLERPDSRRPGRKQLVGLSPVDGRTVVEEGAQLTAAAAAPDGGSSHGHVTSSYWSMATDAPIALALLKGGRDRHGEVVQARAGGTGVACRVVAPVFVDPTGERMNG